MIIDHSCGNLLSTAVQVLCTFTSWSKQCTVWFMPHHVLWFLTFNLLKKLQTKKCIDFCIDIAILTPEILIFISNLKKYVISQRLETKPFAAALTSSIMTWGCVHARGGQSYWSLHSAVLIFPTCLDEKPVFNSDRREYSLAKCSFSSHFIDKVLWS